MSTLELLQLNLLSPVILAFFLGILATLVRSDLRFPEELYQALSLYLLLAIGLKGGVAMVSSPEGGLLLPMAAAVAISACTPLWCMPILRIFGKLDKANAAAIGAHYGSVSVVTFLAATAFLSGVGEQSEGFLPALVAVMEVPGIVVALLIMNSSHSKSKEDTHWLDSVKTVITGKSVFLLLGGLGIGALVGEKGFAPVEPFFDTPFKGVLCLFLLEMGMVASRRFKDLRKVGAFLLAFAMLMPVVHAALGILVGHLTGLSRGGSFMLGVLCASASYIAAPATIRLAIPQANPAYYLTSALAITFPFNLTVGIPLYYKLSGLIAG